MSSYLVEILFEYLFNTLRRWIRRSRLHQYAKAHGYSFYEEDRKNRVQFSAIPFPQDLSASYKIGKAANIIQGSMAGVQFTYFEKTQIWVDEDGRGKPAGTRSVIALGASTNDQFDSNGTFDKNLTFYRENGAICFYWQDANSDRVKPIPIKKLDQWLADIVSTFNAEVVKPASVVHSERKAQDPSPPFAR